MPGLPDGAIEFPDGVTLFVNLFVFAITLFGVMLNVLELFVLLCDMSLESLLPEIDSPEINLITLFVGKIGLPDVKCINLLVWLEEYGSLCLKILLGGSELDLLTLDSST